jgi:hypothetical protein
MMALGSAALKYAQQRQLSSQLEHAHCRTSVQHTSTDPVLSRIKVTASFESNTNSEMPPLPLLELYASKEKKAGDP